MNHKPIQIIIYILPIIISFPVSFHFYVDDYIVSISNTNKPNTREYTAGTVYERTFNLEFRHFGPFNANYGDVFHFLLYNQKEECLYGLGGYFKINGYYISTNSDNSDNSLFQCLNCTHENQCKGTHDPENTKNYRIIGTGDLNDIEFHYLYTISMPSNFQDLLNRRDVNLGNNIEGNADKFTVNLMLGEEININLYRYFNIVIPNYFIECFNDTTVLGDFNEIIFPVYDDIKIIDGDNLIGSIIDIGNGKKNYNITYKSNPSKINGYIETFEYYSYKSLNVEEYRSSNIGKVKIIVCMINCTECPIDGNELTCSKCNTTYYLSEKECVYECEEQVFLKEPYGYNQKKCITKEECYQKGYKIEISDEIPYECIQNCKTDYYNSYDGKECVKCNLENQYINGKSCDDHCYSDFLYLNDGTNICSKICDINFFKSENEISQYICIETCPDHHPYHIKSFNQKECLKECPDIYYNNEETKECLTYEECIDMGFYVNKKKNCTRTCLGTCEYLDDSINQCECTKEEISNILPMELLEIGKIINGKGFYAEVYDTKNIPEFNDNTSSLNISNCEKILRENNNISEEEKLYIVKYDYENEDYLSLNYEIYYNNQKLELLDCSNTEFTVNFKTNDDINIELHQVFFENGIDLFNSDDKFFTDICTVPNIKNNSDITLKDRQKYFYLLEKYNLDESNCRYNNFNSENKRIYFNCFQNNNINNIKQTHRNNHLFQKSRNWFENFLYKNNYNNIMVFKCFNLFSNLKDNLFNLGFWFMLSIFCCQIIAIIYYFCREKVRFNKNLSKIFKHIDKEIPRLNHFKKAKFERYYSSNYRIDINEDTRFDNAFILDKSIYDYKKIFFVPYNIALYYSEKKLCKDFSIIYKMKNLLLSIYNHIYIFELLNVKLSKFLFDISILFLINAFCFNDNVVSIKFMNGKIPLKIQFKKTIISVVVNTFLNYFFFKFFNFSILNLIINENNFSRIFYFNVFKRLIKKIKCKIFYFHFIQLIFTILIWIYLTLYCFVYNNTQWDWFKQAWISYFEKFIINFFFLLFVSILRIISLQKKIKWCYNIYLYLISEY